MKPKVLVITPIEHINGVREILESFSDLNIISDPDMEELYPIISDYDAIYTNPNKSKVYIGKDLLKHASSLKVISTASTGTNHIDKDYTSSEGIEVLSLTEERDVITKITSTAEHAFALTMASLRKIVQSHTNSMKGEWDYTNYIGRQMNMLNIGVLGYGRLGSLYAHYSKSFGANVYALDPYVEIRDEGIKQLDSLKELSQVSDILSIHVHVNEETKGMINYRFLAEMKNDVTIINTSRGEIINESDLVSFLEENKSASFATDVLTDEIRNRQDSPILNYAKESPDQVTITQHIGGMTREAQEIAYQHAAQMLKSFF